MGELNATDTMPRTIIGPRGDASGAAILQLADSHIEGHTTVLYTPLNILHMSEVETLRLVGALISSMNRARGRRAEAGL